MTFPDKVWVAFWAVWVVTILDSIWWIIPCIILLIVEMRAERQEAREK